MAECQARIGSAKRSGDRTEECNLVAQFHGAKCQTAKIISINENAFLMTYFANGNFAGKIALN